MKTAILEYLNGPEFRGLNFEWVHTDPKKHLQFSFERNVYKSSSKSKWNRLVFVFGSYTSRIVFTNPEDAPMFKPRELYLIEYCVNCYGRERLDDPMCYYRTDNDFRQGVLDLYDRKYSELVIPRLRDFRDGKL